MISETERLSILLRSSRFAGEGKGRFVRVNTPAQPRSRVIDNPTKPKTLTNVAGLALVLWAVGWLAGCC